MATETDQPRLVLPTGGVPFAAEKKRESTGSFLPLPNDDELPLGETNAVLDKFYTSIVKVLTGLFTAVKEIVGALLSLVQKLAGREAAETVDRAAAEVLDEILPTLPGRETSPEAPTSETPEGETPSTTGETSSTETPSPETLPAKPPADLPVPALPELDSEQILGAVRTLVGAFATDTERAALADPGSAHSLACRYAAMIVESTARFVRLRDGETPGFADQVAGTTVTPQPDGSHAFTRTTLTVDRTTAEGDRTVVTLDRTTGTADRADALPSAMSPTN